MNHRLRLPASLLAFGVLLTAGFGGIATVAQPTSAWFSDVAAAPWSIAVGDVAPDPDPPAGPEIPWTGQGDEHATLECDGTVRWHFNLTGNLAGIDANLTATFATAGDIGPVELERTGGQPNGALQATLTTPEGDTLEVAVASMNGSPENALLVLSSSSCEPESADEQLETTHVTSETNDEPAQRDTRGSDDDDIEDDVKETSPTTTAPGDAEPEADDPRSPADPEAAGLDEDALDAPEADDHPEEDSVDPADSEDTTAHTHEDP